MINRDEIRKAELEKQAQEIPITELNLEFDEPEGIIDDRELFIPYDGDEHSQVAKSIEKALHPSTQYVRRSLNKPALLPEDMHNRRIDFGKFKGEYWTRVPISYLRRATNLFYGESQRMAELELQRRGTISEQDSKIELTSHSIDRASLKLRREWLTTRKGEDEGLHSWLARMAREAYDTTGIESFDKDSDGKKNRDVTVFHNGMKMVFSIGAYYPVLVSVMPIKD